HREVLGRVLGDAGSSNTAVALYRPHESSGALERSGPAPDRSVESRVTDEGEVSDIAIIGLAGRYPLADTPEAFWENLKAGRDCITEIPASRWDHDAYFDPEKGRAGKSYSKWGGFISGVDEFDALFFNIAPTAAALIDPQERLFLQCAYAA